MKFFQLILGALMLLILSLQVSCSHLSKSDERVLRNSIMVNNDRAPQSLAPQMTEEQIARQNADAHFTLAESYSFQGESAKAIEEFKQTLLLDPNSVTVRMRLAAEYVRSGLINEAIEASESAVKLDPKNTDARMLLAGLYTGVKLFDQAIEQFESVYELDSKNEEAALFIGAVHAEKGDFSKAENHFFRLLKVSGFESKAKVYYYLGKINHEQEKRDDEVTLKHLRKAIQLDPAYRDAVIALSQILIEGNADVAAEKVLLKYQDQQGPDPDFARLLAKVYLKTKQFSKAAEQLAVLSKFDSSNMSLKIQRALIHMELKEKDEAIAILEEILKESPELDKARFYLGALYLDKEQYNKSMENLEKIPSASTYYPESRIQIAQLYKEAGRMGDAEKILIQSIKARPDLPEFVASLATLYDAQKKYEEAQELLEKSTKNFPESTQLKFFMGTIYDRLGKTDDSVKALKEVLDMDADHVQALNYLAYTYAELGKNLDEAERMAKKALRLSPSDPYILDTVGWIYFKKGDMKSAQKYIEAAYRQKPDEAIIVEHLGDVFVKTESWSRAAAMYQQAQVLESDEHKARAIQDKLTAILNQSQPAGRLPASLPGR